MVGGADESDVRPSPLSPAPPSSPARPPGLGRRLLGSFRALASRPAPPPAPKVGLGLLLHLRPGHPASTSAPEEGTAAATGPLNRYRLGVGDAAATSAPANVLQQAHTAEKVEGRATDEPGSAENDDDAVEGQEAVERGVVGRCHTRQLGTTENDAENNVQVAVEQGVAMDDGNAVKDHDVVGRSVIAGTELHTTIGIQDQHNGVDATVNGSDRGVLKKKRVVKLPYPQRPGKLNCPSYMEKGSCSYGFSCQLHHPPLKAKPHGSWCPSEQGNHGVADVLELNRIGFPIREGARNCTLLTTASIVLFPDYS